MVLGVNGGDRISYTYDEIDPDTGDLISTNNKESFFVVSDSLASSIEDIRSYIREHRLAD